MDDHGAGQQSGGGVSERCRVLTLTVLLGLAPVVVSFFLTLDTALGCSNLLGNGGFERGTSGWRASDGATFFTVTHPVSSGNWAAALNSSDAAGWVWIYQDVAIIPGATYTLTGWIYKNHDECDQACLCIKWVDSGAADLQECFSGKSDSYVSITLGPITAPSDAARARIQARVETRVAKPLQPVYFDELRLTSTMMPHGFFPLCLKNYPG